jgi:hypothetical protein
MNFVSREASVFGGSEISKGSIEFIASQWMPVHLSFPGHRESIGAVGHITLSGCVIKARIAAKTRFWASCSLGHAFASEKE